MTDKPKGDGAWISSRRGTGGDVERSERIDEAVKEMEEDGAAKKGPSPDQRRRFAEAKRVLQNAVTSYVRHNESLDEDDRAALAKLVERDFGGKLSAKSRDAIREFVDTAADAAASGDKKTGWRASLGAASTIADDWKPASRFEAAAEADEQPIDEIVDDIDRTVR